MKRRGGGQPARCTFCRFFPECKNKDKDKDKNDKDIVSYVWPLGSWLLVLCWFFVLFYRRCRRCLRCCHRRFGSRCGRSGESCKTKKIEGCMWRVEERGGVKVDVDRWKSDEMGEGMHVDRWQGGSGWVEEWMRMGGC